MKRQAHIAKGAEIAENYLEAASRAIRQLRNSAVRLTLATIQVGQTKDMELYSNYLSKLLKRLDIQWMPHVFPQDERENNIVLKIIGLNANPKITGIMVFSPLPATINPTNILNNIHILKDVEGRTFLKSHFGVFSPTANAVLTLLESHTREFAGKEAVVIGHSDLVGKPTAVLLMDKMATVMVCHAKTRNLQSHIKKADIVVAAAGKPNLIKGAWIKKGAVVIDVGENVVNGKIVGDVEFETAKKRASYISPVPGGVGPVTNVMLIKNLLTLQHLMQLSNGNR